MDGVAPLMHTVVEAMIACGMDNQEMFNDETKATRLANELFNNDFTTTMDKMYEELDTDLKPCSDLTSSRSNPHHTISEAEDQSLHTMDER